MGTQLALHALHQGLGAVFDGRCGWELPFHYGDPAAEHRAVREGAGLIDSSLVGKVGVIGRDRVSFFQGMLTNDLKLLESGQGCPAAFLDAHGKVQTLLSVFLAPEGLFLELPPAMTTRTLQLLDKFQISEKVSFTDLTPAFACFSLQGPLAASVLKEFTAAPLPLEPYRHEERQVDGVGVRLFRVDDTGEGGFHCWVPAEHAASTWTRLLKAGAPFDWTLCETAPAPTQVQVTVPPAATVSTAGFCVVLRTLLKKMSPRFTAMFAGAVGWLVVVTAAESDRSLGAVPAESTTYVVPLPTAVAVVVVPLAGLNVTKPAGRDTQEIVMSALTLSCATPVNGWVPPAVAMDALVSEIVNVSG